MFAPVLAVLAVGVRARYYPDAVESWHAGESAHERVVAYGKVLNETDRVAPPSSWQNEAKATEAAEIWVKAAQDGTLKPMPPAFFTDTTMEGPKVEIEREVARLTSALMAIGDRAQVAGDADRAAKLAILSYRVSEITRTSDLTTLTTGAARQRRTMNMFAAVLPKVSAPVREEVRSLLHERRAPILPTVELTLDLQEDWAKRYKQDPLPSGLRARLTSWASENPADPDKRGAEVRAELAKNEDRDGMETVFNAGRAIANEWSFDAARAKALKTLGE